MSRFKDAADAAYDVATRLQRTKMPRRERRLRAAKR